MKGCSVVDKIGFIGYGSMGSMLLNGFLSAGVLKAPEVVVATRTVNRLNGLKDRWEVEIADDNKKLVEQCKYVFICVKPIEVKEVLSEILQHFRVDVHVISIAASLTIENIESIFKGKITKVIPSLTSDIGAGISLICHNSKVKHNDAKFIESLFASISTVKRINEKDFEAGADLTSCAPGLIAAIFQEFVEAGLRHSTLTREEAEEMVFETLYGTAKLLREKNMGFKEMISRVTTKGGITEEGVQVLRSHLPSAFDELFYKTLAKHDKVKELIDNQFKL
jgi:pyrroline-5-carboxylate reductase